MQKNILSKEDFVKVINKIQQHFDFEERIQQLFYDFGCQAPDLPLPYDAIINILNVMFGLVGEPEDKHYISDIDYFCLELDFGRKYTPGCVTEYGNEVDLSSAEKLYDYITKGMNNGEEE